MSQQALLGKTVTVTLESGQTESVRVADEFVAAGGSVMRVIIVD